MQSVRPVTRIRHSASRGVAAVETAVVLPLVVLLILGAVDIGQFANCHQKVSEVSREGARFAARFETTSVTDVENVVFTCLGDMFPSVPEESLRSGTTVVVRRADGSVMTSNELESVGTGNVVEVEVALQFSTVRWISGLTFLGGRTVQTATAMRRE